MDTVGNGIWNLKTVNKIKKKSKPIYHINKLSNCSQFKYSSYAKKKKKKKKKKK